MSNTVDCLSRLTVLMMFELSKTMNENDFELLLKKAFHSKEIKNDVD